LNCQTWLAHFRANREDRPEPDWGAPFSLGGEKLRLVRKSLAEYQLGDGGGESCLVAADAETYRGASEDAHAVVDASSGGMSATSRSPQCASSSSATKRGTSTFTATVSLRGIRAGWGFCGDGSSTSSVGRVRGSSGSATDAACGRWAAPARNSSPTSSAASGTFSRN
jgi:hypothetical protein